GLRVLRPEDRTVGIVVEDDEFRTPEQDDLRLGWEQHAHRAVKALGPGVDGPERRLRPVHVAHASAHFASTLEERKARMGHGRGLRTCDCAAAVSTESTILQVSAMPTHDPQV